MTRLTQYPKNADGAPMNVQAFLVQNYAGVFPSQITVPPRGPDGRELPISGAIFVDSNGDFISPVALEHYAAAHGVIGDGVTDDTAALQRAVDFVIAAGGGELVLPGNSISLSGSVTISNPQLLNIKGSGSDVTKLISTNNAVPVIRALNCSSVSQGNGYRFHWQGFQIRYATPATNQPNAIGVSFETGTGNAGYGYSNFYWKDVEVVSCYTAVTNDYLNPLAPPNVWGFTWDGCAFTDFYKRAAYITNVGTGGGSPNSRITSCYIQGRVGITYSAAIFYWDCMGTCILTNIEVNVGIFNLDGIFSFQGRTVSIDGIRFESVSFITSVLQAFILSQGAMIKVENVEFANTVVGAGVTAALLRLGANTLGTIDAVQVQPVAGANTGVTGAGTVVPCVETTDNSLVYLGMLNAATDSWSIATAGYCKPRFQILTNGVAINGTKVLGVQGAALPVDATDLATALTLLNAVKSRLHAHGIVA